MKYNCVIIGCGNKGTFADEPKKANHYKYLSYAHAIKKHPDFNLIAVKDINMNKAFNAAKIWNTDVFEFIKHDKIDVLIIATNDDQHMVNIIELVPKIKPKIIVCEKPICTFEQINDFNKVLLCLKDTPIAVNYTRRYTTLYKSYHNKLAFGKLGKFVEGYLYFNGGWEHTASHFVDLCLYFGIDPTKIIYREVNVDYKWIFQWGLIFENDFIQESIKKTAISQTYNNNTLEVMWNVADYLNRGAPLICTGEQAYESLLITRNIMVNYYNKEQVK